MSTQEALTAELVKKPVKILLGGDKIRARSFALETFNPAEIPENKKPSGIFSKSFIKVQAKLNFLHYPYNFIVAILRFFLQKLNSLIYDYQSRT